MRTSKMTTQITYKPGNLVEVRGREWVVLPETRENLIKLRPLGGAENDATLIYLPLEPKVPRPATFDLPNPNKSGSWKAAVLLREALRLKLRAAAGPFRSFGNLNFEPRAYQLVPLLMALKQDTIRLLIADDVGIGKTIEAGLIARELLDRGELARLTVICPPHLCEQWQKELAEKFSIDAEVVRTGTASRLERGLRPDESIFHEYPFTVVSLDYIKSDRRRNEFLRTCPEFVIVDEAHTCVRANTNTRHQRYQLLKGLAESIPSKDMIFLTATPHSGDDTAFHNLLGLLNPEFTVLADTPESEQRRRLRDKLALHFVQRRRGDIAEWKDSVGFPIRESREVTYSLTGEWGELFTDVLAYARTMIESTEGGTVLQQRMSWWAALALLRCVSSSPAAASMALRTRLQATEGETEQAKLQSLDRVASNTVLDEEAEDSLSIGESVPAGTIQFTEDAEELHRLISRADALRGSDSDPKLQTLIEELRQLLKQKFRPIVFCRYISTAHYIGEQLMHTLNSKNIHVEVITGELTSDQREERVENLRTLGDDITYVLVTTDCLSEGVNLQNFFNSAIHYDLSWNPTRHEQREGRVDRFGQASSTVRALMIYGENNPVDGAVLRVILRKAEKIRKELGISVPIPTDNNKIVEAIMKAILLHKSTHRRSVQAEINFSDNLSDIETELEEAWQTTKKKMTGTVFAQRRLKPDDVLKEWQKAVSVLGGSDDVARFLRLSTEYLDAPLNAKEKYYELPIAHFPKPLQDRLETIGFTTSANLSFVQPAPVGATYIHRAHPLISTLADYISEQALDRNSQEFHARTTAIFTSDVEIRTVLYMLRLRCQIQIGRRDHERELLPVKSLLSEECFTVAIRGSESAELLPEKETLSLLSLEADSNMTEGQKVHFIHQALGELPSREEIFNNIANDRAQRLLEDHRRIRAASDLKGYRYNVVPALPIDKIGIYVLVPKVNW